MRMNSELIIRLRSAFYVAMENGGKDVKVISNFSRSKTGIVLLVLGLCAFVFVLYTLSYRRGGIDLQDFDFEDRLKAGETWKSGLEEMVDVPEVELPRPKQSAINCRWSNQYTQNICMTFIQCWLNVEDVEPTLYKCYTNVLCWLGMDTF